MTASEAKRMTDGQIENAVDTKQRCDAWRYPHADYRKLPSSVQRKTRNGDTKVFYTRAEAISAVFIIRRVKVDRTRTSRREVIGRHRPHAVRQQERLATMPQGEGEKWTHVPNANLFRAGGRCSAFLAQYGLVPDPGASRHGGDG